MKSLCYVNGEIQSTSDGVIGISDLGLQRGYGVFEFARTYNGKLFHFDDNIRRLRRSADELHLAPPVSDLEIREIALQLMNSSNLKTPCVRLILTGGYSQASPSFKNPNFIIVAEELPIHPEKVYAEGAKVIAIEYQRELPHVKSINYLNAIRLEPVKREKGAFDILFHSENGITECPRSNFFAFRGDTLITPSDHILHGITRSIVLRLAEGHFPIEERSVAFDELVHVDEAFATSTSKRIVPITRIDDQAVGNGMVGNRTREIMRLFNEYTEER